MDSEKPLAGGIPMVNIDGAKIRRIREEKGLTQLYVATVVGVTTDTISRWENRRYPTIKKENGVKLAEALESQLADIIDHGQPAPPGRAAVRPGLRAARAGTAGAAASRDSNRASRAGALSRARTNRAANRAAQAPP